MQEVTLLSNVFIFKYYKPFLGEMLFFFFPLRELRCVTLLCGAQQLPQNAEILPNYFFDRN